MQRLLLIVPIVIALGIIFSFWAPEDPPLPIRVGILHSLTGTMAKSEKPVMEATLLAIEQINHNGGVLGRQIEPIIVDGESDWRVFAREAERLIVDERVSVVFGCWTSASRKTVKPIFENHRHLLFYPVQYEGVEQSPNIVYLGAAPNQQIIPGTAWAVQNIGPRIYLVGSDYVFPRVANWLIRKQISALQGEVVGEAYLPLGAMAPQAIISEIQRLKPDVIINTINGDSNIEFFRQFNLAGMTAEDFPVLSFSLGEVELAQMPDTVETIGHYAAWSYFQSIENSQNRAFVEAYQARFGAGRPVSDPMEAAWSGVRLWAEAVESATSDNIDVVRQAIDYQSLRAPEGVISIDHNTHHAWKAVRIGKIGHNRQFEVVWASDGAVRPEPYPKVITRQEADLFLGTLYEGWGGAWALTEAGLGHE